MRLNSCFPETRKLCPTAGSSKTSELRQASANSAKRPSIRVRLMTSSPTAFIIRSSRSSEMRTDLACGRACAATGRVAAESGLGVSVVSEHDAASSPDASSARFPGCLFGRELGNAREERINFCRHFGIGFHARWRNFFRASTDSSNKSTISALGWKGPSRSRPTRSSTRWDTADSRCRPTCAAEPFTVCIDRNNRLMSSALGWPSRASRHSVTDCKCSSASGIKNSRTSWGTSLSPAAHRRAKRPGKS